MSQTVSLSALHAFLPCTPCPRSAPPDGPRWGSRWSPQSDGSFSCPGRGPTGPAHNHQGMVHPRGLCQGWPAELRAAPLPPSPQETPAT